MISTPDEFKILLVEDQPTVMKIHKMMLEEIGYRPDTAENGQQAIAMAQANQYSLVLMDIGLPDINGIEATLQIKQTDQGKATPIVALTAYAAKDVEEKCLAAGMEKVLNKPMTIDALSQLLCVYSIKYQGRQMRTGKKISVPSNLLDDLKKLKTLTVIKEGASRELLDYFASSLPALRLELDKLIRSGDIDTLVFVINREYGGLCYTGTPQLQAAFRMLETALINGEIYQMEELYQTVLATLDTFEAVYKEMEYT